MSNSPFKKIFPFRNIGYGTQNTMARVGAVIGPQLVFLVSTSQ